MSEGKVDELEQDLSMFKTSIEKFQYLIGLKNLSWQDCQDAWFASVKLMPKIEKEFTALQARCEKLEEAIKGNAHALGYAFGLVQRRHDVDEGMKQLCKKASADIKAIISGQALEEAKGG